MLNDFLRKPRTSLANTHSVFNIMGARGMLPNRRPVIIYHLAGITGTKSKSFLLR